MDLWFVYNHSYCALGDYGSCRIRDTERSQTTEDVFHGFWTWWRSKILLFLIPNHWFLLGTNFKNTLTEGLRFLQQCSGVFRSSVMWSCVPGILKEHSAIFFLDSLTLEGGRHHIPLKSWELLTQQQCITCQKTRVLKKIKVQAVFTHHPHECLPFTGSACQPPFSSELCKQLSNTWHDMICFSSSSLVISRDSSVGIVTELWAQWSRFQILAAARQFYLLQNIQPSSGTHPASYSKGTGGLFPLGKAVGAWGWPRPSSNAGVKNEWSYTSTPYVPS
jgi:hypothetical protein